MMTQKIPPAVLLFPSFLKRRDRPLKDTGFFLEILYKMELELNFKSRGKFTLSGKCWYWNNLLTF